MRHVPIALLLALAACGADVPTEQAPVSTPAPAKTSQPNLLLITLDTVRADRLGAYGDEGAVTPHLDALAARGVRFEETIAVAPVTLPTHASILTGSYPQAHGARDNGTFVLSEDAETLAERLSASGYDTAAVISASVLEARYGLDQGFRTYDDTLVGGAERERFMVEETTADRTIQRALVQLNDLQEPFFLWVHLFDAHAPYQAPPESVAKQPRHPYDAEVTWVDEQVGLLLSHLDRRGLSDRTMVSVTADHGESLGEHGEVSHGIFVYRSTTHVPWILAGPGIPPGVVTGVVSQIDIAPTLATVLDVPPSDGVDGISLARLLTGGSRAAPERVALSESLHTMFVMGWSPLRALDSGTQKYVEAPRPELYDLKADPTEQNNLLEQTSPPDAAPLVAALVELTGGERLQDITARDADADALRMLTELGYVDDIPADTRHAAADPKDVLPYFVQLQVAQQHLRDGQPEQALAELKQLLRHDEGNLAALLTLAETLGELSRWEAQEQVLQEVLSRSPGEARATSELAERRFQAGDRARAIAMLENLRASGTPDHVPLASLGRFYLANGQAEEAVSAYRDALTRRPDHVFSLIGLAHAYIATGAPDEAKQMVRQINPDQLRDAAAWFDLARAQALLGDVLGATRAYQMSISLDPENADAHNNLGQLHAVRGDMQQAKAAFQNSLRVDPKQLEAQLNLANVLLSQRDQVPLAIPLLEQAIAAHPDLLVPRQNLIRALIGTGQAPRAEPHLLWLAEHGPDPSAALVRLAQLRAKAQDTSGATTFLEQARRHDAERTRQLVDADPLLSRLAP